MGKREGGSGGGRQWRRKPSLPNALKQTALRALLIRGAVEERSPDRTPSYPLGLHPVAGGKGRGGRARTPSVFLFVRDLFAAIAAVMRYYACGVVLDFIINRVGSVLFNPE